MHGSSYNDCTVYTIFTCDMHGSSHCEDECSIEFFWFIWQEARTSGLTKYPGQLWLHLKTAQPSNQPQGRALHTVNNNQHCQQQSKLSTTINTVNNNQNYRFWLTTAINGSGWLITAVAGSGWITTAITGSGWLITAITGSGWLTTAVVGSGWFELTGWGGVGGSVAVSGSVAVCGGGGSWTSPGACVGSPRRCVWTPWVVTDLEIKTSLSQVNFTDIFQYAFHF
jgi:hypothetical protein